MYHERLDHFEWTVRPCRTSTRVQKGGSAICIRPTSADQRHQCLQGGILVSFLANLLETLVCDEGLLPDLFLRLPVGISLFHELERSAKQAYVFEFDAGPGSVARDNVSLTKI